MTVNTGKLVTTETWAKYLETKGLDNGFYDYIEANEEFCEVLEMMLENSKSLQDLKNNLSDLVAERKDFIKFASDRFP